MLDRDSKNLFIPIVVSIDMQIFLNIASKFLSMLFRDQFCCALNMMLLCVSAIIALELMALSLGLGALAPKITPCHLNVLISLIVASLFHIFAVYCSIGLCFGYDALVGLCYHTSRAHDPIKRFWVPLSRGHLLTGCLLRGSLLR